MAVSGVTGSPSIYCLNVAVQEVKTPLKQVCSFSSWGHAKEKLNMLRVERCSFSLCISEVVVKSKYADTLYMIILQKPVS